MMIVAAMDPSPVLSGRHPVRICKQKDFHHASSSAFGRNWRKKPATRSFDASCAFLRRSGWWPGPSA